MVVFQPMTVFQAELPEEQGSHDDGVAVRHRHRLRQGNQDQIPRFEPRFNLLL